MASWASTLFRLLGDNRMQVVQFDSEAAACFWQLPRRLNFNEAPIKKPNEDHKRAFDRLRFDLLVFAAALRHQRPLLTNNNVEFVHFGFPTSWQTEKEYLGSL